jgi:probable rRNA maturation factor
MTPVIEIAVEADAWSAAGNLEDLSARAVAAAIAETRVELMQGAELSLLFTDDAAIRELNRTWRAQDKPTNVLSFPAADPDALARAPLLGDIVLAYETIRREAEAERKNFNDHLTHLIVHGFLHLVGYDHEVDADAEVMEARERAILARLHIADPYFEDRSKPDLDHEQL